MGRRFAILLAGCCLVPLLLAAALGLRGVAGESRQMAQAVRAARGLALADALSARISVADSLAAALLAGDRGGEAAPLRVATESSGVFARVLIDAEDVVVHIFRPEVRSFYNLERMWSFGDAPEVVNG